MLEKTSSFFERIRMNATPVANSAAVVICGQARFTVLTNRLIRMEWSTAGQFEDRATFAFPTRYAQSPNFSQQVERNCLTLKTDALTLHYTDTGDEFNENNLSIQLNVAGKKVEWKPGMVNVGNLRGTRRTLDQCADSARLQEGLLSREGWALFDDSGTPVWDMDQTWVEARNDAHKQDWYFFGYGHDYKTALKDYVHFGGNIPLIPRFVLGAWWSRYWAYSADDLLQLVNDFQSHDLPLDVLVVDMDWHTPDGWTGYTWNRELFPDPEAFLAEVHRQGLAVTLNLHPADGIQKHEEAYPQFAELIGHDISLGEGIKFRCTDEQFMQHYFELLHHPMEDQGVDFWWLDWQQGDSSDVKNLDPLAWLNHLHFQDSSRRGNRPMLYSRWGGLGNHRYHIGFSGDTYATWESLCFQPYFTATAANVCYGWWSHDIGGHFGATDPELYARWVQFGAVSPCLRLHSTKEAIAERRPWGFPEKVFEAAKAAFQFRYRMIPYLYSAARTAAKQGLSLCYPMYYEYPSHEDAYFARNQYFLGNQMFVAPVVTPSDPATGLATADVWIPEGTWTEYTTLETFVGSRWVRLYVDLNRIPMFVKAGGIVPQAPQTMHTKDIDGSNFIISVFPGGDGEFELYEDDGVTDHYRHNSCETTLIRTNTIESSIGVSIGGAEGVCTTLPFNRTIELRVKAIRQPHTVTVNGKVYTEWVYHLESNTLEIVFKDTNRREALEILIEAVPTTPDLFPSTEPFAHFVDYDLYDDARLHLGTVIVTNDNETVPNEKAPFDVDIEWTLMRGATKTVVPVTLKQCTSQQILHSPFADDDSLNSFKWGAVVNIHQQGKDFHYEYQSKVAYPSINRWQTLIYNPEQQALSLSDVILPQGTFNPELTWERVSQTPGGMFNLKQPFGLILLEQERQRITSGEPLAACVGTTLTSQSAREVILNLQCVGEYTCYLNGAELSPTTAIDHEPLQPMFYSWMPPQQTYYKVSLQQGINQFVIFTRPNASVGWWGVGAIIYDQVGNVLTDITDVVPER